MDNSQTRSTQCETLYLFIYFQVELRMLLCEIGLPLQLNNYSYTSILC